MRNNNPSKTPIGIAVATALVMVSSSAHPASFALLEQSASRLGTAFAGSAAASDDATTIFFNPAGLVHVDDIEAIVIPSAISINSEFHNKASSAALGQPLGNSGGNAGGWNLVPSAYASMPIGESLAIGVGVNAPFGLKLEYDNGWIGRFQALKSELKTTNVNPTIAYQVNDFLSIGVGIDYQMIEAELTNAVNYTAVIAQGLQQLAALGQLSPAAIPGLIGANAGLEGHARVQGDDHTWGYNLGVMIEPTGATRIGLAYRSSMDYKLEGSAHFRSPTTTNPVGASIVAAAIGPNGALTDGPVSVDLKLPDSAIASLRQRIGDRFELLADVGWTGWSSVQELRVKRPNGATVSATPEHWKDIWRFALGGTYAFTPQLKFRAGVAFDNTPVPDSTRTPRLPDVDRTWLAIGAHWQQSDTISMDFGYAHLFSDGVPLNQNAGNATAYGLLNGEQKSAIDIVSVQVALHF